MPLNTIIYYTGRFLSLQNYIKFIINHKKNLKIIRNHSRIESMFIFLKENCKNHQN